MDRLKIVLFYLFFSNSILVSWAGIWLTHLCLCLQRQRCILNELGVTSKTEILKEMRVESWVHAALRTKFHPPFTTKLKYEWCTRDLICLRNEQYVKIVQKVKKRKKYKNSGENQTFIFYSLFHYCIFHLWEFCVIFMQMNGSSRWRGTQIGFFAIQPIWCWPWRLWRMGRGVLWLLQSCREYFFVFVSLNFFHKTIEYLLGCRKNGHSHEARHGS